MTELTIARELQLQWLLGRRVEAAERPVLAPEPGPDLLHQMQRPLVLVANQVALRRDFEPLRAGLGISTCWPRAVDIEREQYSARKLLKVWLALQSLDCIG